MSIKGFEPTRRAAAALRGAIAAGASPADAFAAMTEELAVKRMPRRPFHNVYFYGCKNPMDGRKFYQLMKCRGAA